MDATTRAVHVSVDELLAGATDRAPIQPGDGLSFVPMERLRIDGASYVAKWLGTDIDWIMRATGDVHPRVVRMWQAGVLDALPAELDHTIEAIAYDAGTRRTVLLMRDVGDHFLPEGHQPFELAAHHRFLDHMAAMHAAFWGWEDTLGLLPESVRYLALTPYTTAAEATIGTPSGVPAMLVDAWAALAERAGAVGGRVRALADDPTPLVAAMADLPKTLVHGDWKAGNLGSHPDGRTILVDWAWPGLGSPLVDLGWYLAVNSTRLPESKEATIAAYRGALTGRGIDVSGWWDRALELALAGAFVQLGWSKTGEPAELGWWVERTGPTLRALA